MGIVQNIVDKLHIDRYFSSKLILAFDLFASLSASICALVFIKTLLFSTLVTWPFILVYLLASLGTSFIFFFWLKTYRTIVRHSTLKEFSKLCLASFLKVVLMGAIFLFLPYSIKSYIFYLMSLDFIVTVFVLLMLRVAMIVMYDSLRNKVRDTRKRLNVMIYGCGEKAVAVEQRLHNSVHYNVIGYLKSGLRLRGQKINGIKIFYYEKMEDIKLFQDRFFLDAILFPRESDLKKEDQRLVEYCQEHDIKILLAPSIEEVVDGKTMNNPIREVKIEDLLGRDEIEISMDVIKANFKGKTVMVTGAAGSIGSELCRQLATFEPEKHVLFDNGETPMHNLRLELEERYKKLNFVPVIGDVREKDRLDYVFRKHHPQVVFHAAAYKHVPLME